MGYNTPPGADKDIEETFADEEEDLKELDPYDYLDYLENVREYEESIRDD